MDRTLPTVVVVAVILLLLIGMFFGWRARKRRQADVPRPQKVPADVGAEIVTLDLFYVATTVGGEPLNRIAVSGLGFRSKAYLSVAEKGIVLAIAGEPEGFIPATDILEVKRATWTIDRVVEDGGLVAVSWTLGDQVVDSYLRVISPTDPAELVEAIQKIIVETADRKERA